MLLTIVLVRRSLRSVSYGLYYGGPSVKEKTKFKFIFTPVYWGENKSLNLFSLPFIGERKYIQIYFQSRLLGRENIFKFIFTPVYWASIGSYKY